VISNAFQIVLIISSISGGSILSFNRREFLKLSAGAFTATFLPLQTLAATLSKTDSQRRLSFYNTHTRESIDVCYFEQGAYCRDALNQINYILRDHRAREVHPIDVRLIDHLYTIKSKVCPKAPFHVISGYRSPVTNGMLRKKTKGVARASYHTKGQAIDIRLPSYRTDHLRDLCVAMKFGGVGYYAKSNFVHLDTGPVRCW
jgi:uncharacterized protein YcbK (DUF882 family)